MKTELLFELLPVIIIMMTALPGTQIIYRWKNISKLKATYLQWRNTHKFHRVITPGLT